MNKRRVQFWVWWLLPFLVARALMPVGFMAHVDHGQFKLALCSAGFAKAVSNSFNDFNTSEASQDTNYHDNNGAHHADTCPFAYSGGAALSAFVAPAVAKLPGIGDLASSLTQAPFTARPSRSHRVRGPPVFS